ncbi:MAG: hypothetical protein ABIF10_07205 [Candidatus Woesearchaeota archaeon]
MNICKKCKGHRIKTRTGTSYCKQYSIPVECKDCGSTEFIDSEKKWGNWRR